MEDIRDLETAITQTVTTYRTKRRALYDAETFAPVGDPEQTRREEERLYGETSYKLREIDRTAAALIDAEAIRLESLDGITLRHLEPVRLAKLNGLIPLLQADLKNDIGAFTRAARAALTAHDKVTMLAYLRVGREALNAARDHEDTDQIAELRVLLPQLDYATMPEHARMILSDAAARRDAAQGIQAQVAAAMWQVSPGGRMGNQVALENHLREHHRTNPEGTPKALFPVNY